MSDYARALRGISDALEAISTDDQARPAMLRTAHAMLTEVAAQMAAEADPAKPEPVDDDD